MAAGNNNDVALENEIFRLQSAIKDWAVAKDIWHDSGFKSYLDHVKGEPDRSYPVVTILYSTGLLQEVIDGSSLCEWQDEFLDFVNKLGYECENINGYNFHFYPTDNALIAAFGEYFHWKWVCTLIQPDFDDVYDELYGYFANRPDRLSELDWREFEVLLFRIFQQQGFQAELGTGRGDGGIDIKLLQRDPLGDMLTLVQAKKYAPHRKIQLEAVAALHGIAAMEKAQGTIFVTTSEYAPVAKNFAARTSGALQLKTSDDVALWCKTASDGIIVDKSMLVSRKSVQKIIQQVNGQRDPRILHTSWGYNMVHNSFALVLKETKYAALLMALPNSVISHDGYGQRGIEIPALNDTALSMHTANMVWRAKRSVVESSRVSYWDGENLYFPWDGNPKSFDYMD